MLATQINSFSFWTGLRRTPFKVLYVKEDSDEYIKLENKIVQAGGIWGLTPNIVQLFRMIFPAMGFVFMLSFYLIRQATVSVSLTPPLWNR